MRNGFHDKAIKDLDFIDKQIVYYETKFFESRDDLRESYTVMPKTLHCLNSFYQTMIETLERKRRRIIVEELDLYD